MIKNTILNIPLVKKNRNTVLKYSDSFILIPIRFLITPYSFEPPSIWNVDLVLKMDATVKAVYFILFNFCLNSN